MSITHITLQELLTPKHKSLVYVNAWWIFDKDCNAVFHGTKNTPHCASNELIAYILCNYKEGEFLKHIKIAYIPHRIHTVHDQDN